MFTTHASSVFPELLCRVRRTLLDTVAELTQYVLLGRQGCAERDAFELELERR